MTFKLVDVNRLMDNARTSLPGALDGAIKQEIFNVLSEFFQKTDLWVEDIDFPVSTANERGTTTDIAASAGTINRLMYVLDADRSQRQMSMPEPGVLLFHSVPGSAGIWTARVALSVADPIPTGGALAGFPQAPDWVLTKYHNGLLGGVVGAMMAQVGKPYTNAKMATFHMAKFRNALSEGRTQSRHQNLYAAQAWRFPSYGSNGRVSG